jgi:hypothetical protein
MCSIEQQLEDVMRTGSLSAVAAVLAAFFLNPATGKAQGNNYAGCEQGWQRYATVSSRYQAAQDLCAQAGGVDRPTPAIDRACALKSALCRQIAPEVGYAYCERFLASGIGSPQERANASRFAAALKAVYQTCNAQ